MNPMEPAVRHPASDRAGTQPEPDELSMLDHAMLSPCQGSDSLLT
jgi:hypothetical protein